MTDTLDRFDGWLRWQIAQVMNHFSDTCWADLVMWATYRNIHEFGEILSMRGTAGFCALHGAPPYCGKCEDTTND